MTAPALEDKAAGAAQAGLGSKMRRNQINVTLHDYCWDAATWLQAIASTVLHGIGSHMGPWGSSGCTALFL